MKSNNRPWDSWVERVLIHTPHYLEFDGNSSTGGRERHIRDLATVVRERWGRPVVIVQKGLENFETVCPEGFDVIGLKCDTSTRSDPLHGWRSRRLARPTDGVLYASAEDAWPFFAAEAKGVQHGIWWDGPFARWKRVLNRWRVMHFMKAVRSVLCVDTNFINWVRCQGQTGVELCNKCSYVPNYADILRMPAPQLRTAPSRPLRVIYARRFEFKRGPHLLLDALAILKKRNFPFSATMFSVGGHDELAAGLIERGIRDDVSIQSEGLDGIHAQYQNADVAVVPTIWSEGTSLACAEAICAGLPVVTTPVGGLAN